MFYPFVNSNEMIDARCAFNERNEKTYCIQLKRDFIFQGFYLTRAPACISQSELKTPKF